MVDANSWNVLSSGGTKSFSVTSNAIWRVESTDNNWLHIEPVGSVTGNSTITVTADANTSNSSRIGTIRIVSDELEEEIKVVQYDEFSEKFVELNNDNTISLKSSSDYNHDLATWAMELSYAAYNPVDYELIPGIPSSFMQEPFDDETKTAEAELERMGFDATSYNYEGGYSGYAAHTIGHRNITISENYNSTGGNENGIINGFNDTNISIYSSDIYRQYSIGNGDTSSNTGVISTAFSTIDASTGEPVSTVLNSTSTNADSYSTRQLVVISVRGSVTPMDWAMDLANQINLEYINFGTGCQEVIESLNGYLTTNGIGNPIILVTGHSLGAAIANLVAAELNETEGAEDVFSYTFATPNTVNAADSEEPTHYTNIFNILNNNDLVPHFPMDFLENVWTRHGRDFYITMPWVTDGIKLFDVDMLGVFGHGMPTYYSWINSLPEMLGKAAGDLTVADLEMLSEDVAVGLFAKLVKVKCPVSVTAYDSSGNIVAYESQQEGVIYPEITDAGIVSWITENGEKMFLIPYGSEAIDVHIEAYDYGTMNLTLEQPGVGEPLNTITYNNVNLYPDKEFLVEVSEEVLPEDTQLFVTENGEIVGEVTETDPPLKGVTVNHEEKTDRVVTYLTFVTDNTVSEIRFYKIGGNSTSYIFPTSSHATVVEDGDNLIWTAGYVYNTAGDYSYDVSVKSGEEWHYYENVFTVHIPQEYIDIKNGTLETNSRIVSYDNTSDNIPLCYPIDDVEGNEITTDFNAQLDESMYIDNTNEHKSKLK